MGNKNTKSKHEDETSMNGTTQERDDSIVITQESSLKDKEIGATSLLMQNIQDKRLETVTNISEQPLSVEDNSSFSYNYSRLDVPLDEDGYVQSFSLGDPVGIQTFFKKYGVVIVRDVLTEEECSKSQDEIWDFLSRHSFAGYIVDRHDTNSWEFWPALKKLGILGNTVNLSPQLCDNRQNPKVHEAFSIVHGTEKLFVTVDRASAMRPTRDVKFMKDGKEVVMDRPDWKTLDDWLHWDMNPWTGKTSTYATKETDTSANRGYDLLKVQGILALVDCRSQDGGFHCIPGFQNHLRGWANANLDRFNSKDPETTFQIPQTDPMRSDIQRMPMRRGSILIWDSSLPHGTFPNDSEAGRMVQYIRFVNCKDASCTSWLPEKYLPQDGFQLTQLGRKIYGYDSWDSIQPNANIK